MPLRLRARMGLKWFCSTAVQNVQDTGVYPQMTQMDADVKPGAVMFNMCPECVQNDKSVNGKW